MLYYILFNSKIEYFTKYIDLNFTDYLLTKKCIYIILFSLVFHAFLMLSAITMVATARETAKPHSETKMSAVPIFFLKNLPENHFLKHMHKTHTLV